jgi:hypothetical protein
MIHLRALSASPDGAAIQIGMAIPALHGKEQNRQRPAPKGWEAPASHCLGSIARKEAASAGTGHAPWLAGRSWRCSRRSFHLKHLSMELNQSAFYVCGKTREHSSTTACETISMTGGGCSKRRGSPPMTASRAAPARLHVARPGGSLGAPRARASNGGPGRCISRCHGVWETRPPSVHASPMKGKAHDRRRGHKQRHEDPRGCKAGVAAQPTCGLIHVVDGWHRVWAQPHVHCTQRGGQTCLGMSLRGTARFPF